VTRKRLAPARWVLPAVVDPPGRICFQIRVPDEPQHVAAFLGAIYDLAKPYKWANDDAHTAIDVGAVWFGIFEALRRNSCECSPDVGIGGDDMPRLRQNPTNPCLLEQECLPDQWVTLFDASLCLQSSPGQPSPGGPGPGPGEAQQFCLSLNANGQVLLPIAVQEDWTIEIMQRQGGWTDGGGDWNCPNGQSYILGLCSGVGGLDGSDPLPTALHMSVIAQIDTLFYNGNAIITVPHGLSDQKVVFQANDATLSDNFGTVSFCVKVTAAAVLPHTIAYTHGSGPSAFNYGDIVTITAQDIGSDVRLDISLSVTAKMTILSASGYVNTATPGPGNVFLVVQHPLGTNTSTLADPPSTTPTDLAANTLMDALAVDTGAPGVVFSVQLKLDAP